MKIKTLLLFAGILLAGYIAYRSYRIATQDKGLDVMIAKGAVILDVRTKTEFDRGHIKGSVNIPLSKLHKGLILLDTHCVIITCCSHGLRSVKALSVLRERGYNKVYNGGAWSDLEQSLRKKEK